MIQMEKKKVVIVGGGFAGIEVAKVLEKERGVSVTLVTKEPFFEYYPALYKLVTGAMAIEVCVPYEKIFRKNSITVIQGVYSSYDAVKKEITLSDGRTLGYDYLVLAVGSEVNYFGIPGIEQYAFSFKSAAQALELKQHLLGLLQESKDVPKEELVKRFHVTVVGGGPSGVELAGDITTYLRKMTKRYHIDPSFVTVDLIESNSRVLKMLPEKVSARAEARLRKLKVNIYTNRTLEEQDLSQITASGMTLDSGTVIWTAGTRLNNVLTSFPLNERKVVSVASDFTLPGDEAVYVIGDGAGATGSGLAQGAIAHGKYVGNALIQKMKGQTPAPFSGALTGYVVPIGHGWAVFTYKKIVVSGWIPWLLRSFVDFRYFTTIVAPQYVLEVFRQGAKYRRGEY